MAGYRTTETLIRLTRQRPGLCLAALLAFLPGLLFYASLPGELFDQPVSPVMLDGQQQLLAARIARDQQWRFPPVDHVPEKFARALVSYEDQRFYTHAGVDPLAVLRAAWLNLKHRRIVSGASTLSMQVMRLSRNNPSRTLAEKALESLLALRLELAYSKQEILALYAGHAPFGGNVVGLEAAAWRYFARRPDDLSWAESAMLAVLPNSPALIHPGRQRHALKKKRDQLLQRLHHQGELSDTDLRLAMLEPLPDEPQPMPHLADHLLATLEQQYADRHRFHTTLDRQLQVAVNNVVSRHSQPLHLQVIHNLAVMVMDHQRFEVLAYVANAPDDQQVEHGHAVDIIQRPRSTGSLLKPLLFASMIQQSELLPTTLVADVPTRFAGYIPENYDRLYRGAVPARQALARSLNIPAVRMLKQHGVARFYDFLHNMGMHSLNRHPDDYGLTLILGGAEGTLWDMTTLYANLAQLARSGADATNHYLKPRLQADDAIDTGRRSELGAASAWLTLDALLEVNRPGNEQYWRNFSSTRRVAWKTGTSYGLRDGWAIGSDGRYTVGVWVGNASGEGRAGLTGLATAAPVLFDVFNLLPAGGWFERPAAQMKTVSVCEKDGYLSNGHCREQQQWVPRENRFDQVSPHFKLVHLDQQGHYQVHSQCEATAKMQHRYWFQLPPVQAYYYRLHHSHYLQLPPLRKDCQPALNHAPFDLVYPEKGTRLYIPTDLAAQRGQAVFEAVHREENALIYWHLDDRFIAETRHFHQLALDILPGKHTLTLVDQGGYRLQRRFEVLGKYAAE